MICSLHLEHFAPRGALPLASNPRSTAPLHGILPVAPFASHRKIRRPKAPFEWEGAVREVEMLLDYQCYGKVSPAIGFSPKKKVMVGAGENIGYTAAVESDRNHQANSNGRCSSAADETLDMLGWPSLCDAVARFATTVMGKELCHGLAPPGTKEESQMLLDETSAALEIDGILGGVLDFAALQTPIV